MRGRDRRAPRLAPPVRDTSSNFPVMSTHATIEDTNGYRAAPSNSAAPRSASAVMRSSSGYVVSPG